MTCQWLDLQVLKRGYQHQKKVQLCDGATVGDIIKKIAKHKQVPTNQLFLTESRWTDNAHCLCHVGPPEDVPYFSGDAVQVKLHNNEVPEAEVQLGGVDDLEGLPDIITVEPKFVRRELTLEEGMAMQDDFVAAYSEDSVQQGVEKLQQKVLSGKVPKNKYPRMLSDVLLAPRRKVLKKWEFEPPPKGLLHLNEAMAGYEELDQVKLVFNIINGLIGLDLAWLPAAAEESAPPATEVAVREE